MVMLTVTNDGTRNFVEESRKATPATAGVTAHVDRDVLIPSEWNWHRQLHQRLLHHIQISLIIARGTAWTRN